MHKDSLILLLMLAAFALIGADCKAPWDEEKDEERPLPDRALASSPLLRAYYDTRTFPEEMRELKIPEGVDFEDDELTIEYEMGGAETVTEVRTHFYLMPPEKTEFDTCELICRCIAPDDTESAWKAVDVQLSGVFDPQVEIPFLFEFDGLPSDGLWKIQIRDHQADGDGRCLFRNGSLHINRGEDSTPGGATNETDTLNAATGLYGTIPEAAGKREPLDLGWFGVDRMLRNDFTFATSFFVQSITLTASFYANVDSQFEERTNWFLVSPSGNWLALAFGDNPTGSVELSDSVTALTYTFTIGSLPAGALLNLNGEPSAGTWSLYIVDTLKDNNTSTLTTDEAVTTGGMILPNTGALTLQLAGIG